MQEISLSLPEIKFLDETGLRKEMPTTLSVGRSRDVDDDDVLEFGLFFTYFV